MVLENNLFEAYQLRFLLGLGQVGEAWLAIRLMPRSEVVIKLIPVRNLSHKSDKDFISKVQAIARLQHPGILPLIDYGRTEGYFYLVTPYKAKGSLQQLLQTERLTEFQAFEIVGQVLAALNYAHRQAMVHGNLKPSNLLLNNNLRWLVANFGMAEIENKLTEPTLDKALLTPSPYLAPEQYQGQTSYRSDLYAVGMLFYRLLTGTERTGNIADDSPDLSESLLLPHPLVPTALEPILKQALQKEPEKRFGSADEMGRALDKAISHLPVTFIQAKNGDASASTTSPLPPGSRLPGQLAATLPRPDLESKSVQTTAQSFHSAPFLQEIPTKPYTPVANTNSSLEILQPEFSSLLTPASLTAARLEHESGLMPLNSENAVTAPYSFSSLLSNLDELEDHPEFVYDEVRIGTPGNEKGWYVPATLGLIFLLLLAIGLAVLVVLLSL